jgi:hypothetical protein
MRGEEQVSARARRSEISAVIKGMRPEHVQCRDFGHAWRPYTATQEGKVWRRTLECTRCGALRKQSFMDGSGDIKGNTYVHAEGYRIEGLGHLTGTDRGQLRLFDVHRQQG